MSLYTALMNTESGTAISNHAVLSPQYPSNVQPNAPLIEATSANFRPDISIVIPVFNEVECIESLHQQLLAVLEKNEPTWEIIYVDDGSTDGTLPLLKRIAESDKRSILIDFIRNYGKTPAMCAGIDRAQGKVIIFMDADLQNDPKDIPRLLEKLDEGFDVVSGRRKNRQDEFFLRLVPSWFANRLIAKVTGVNLKDYGCCLKAFRSEYIKDAKLYGEMHRFVPIYAAWKGARIAEIPVIHHPRTTGQSKYGISRTFRVILDLINVAFMANFMTAPIYVFGAFGLSCFCLSFLACVALGAVFAFASSPILTVILPILAVLFGLGGIQFILLGLLSEVLARTYFEAQISAST